MRVLVSHPGSQHAHQLAWALEEAGYLTAFWSGVPVVNSNDCTIHYFEIATKRLRKVPIPSCKRKHWMIFPFLRKLLGFRLFSSVANSWSHKLDHAYDKFVATKIRLLQPEIVICYENAALNTFKEAKKYGALCILDAASVHYKAAEHWLAGSGSLNPHWINLQKQREIELADAILTCSDFAANTYRAAGVEDGKLFPVPLGTFLPRISKSLQLNSSVCSFVFVGTIRRLKGVDILIEVFEELQKEQIPVSLKMIGGFIESDLINRAKKISNVMVSPHVSQNELFLEVARHDCLILPSRFDSFGMVVPEAMAVGVPAIVTDRVGAKCIIEKHPGAGWIISFDKMALKQKIISLVNNKELLMAAASAARLAAQDFTWQSYRLRVTSVIEYIYARHK
jgi:glycosyltransferase involved in cell wall biosynthesis